MTRRLPPTLVAGAILVGPNVGNQSIFFNGSGGVRANGSAQDLILHQNNTNGDLVFNTVIATATGGSASPLVKTGPGRVILAVTMGYTGATKVEQGTLVVNGSTTVASTVNVNNGATLGGSGFIGGAVNIANGATLAPGNSGVGTLAISNALTFSAGTNFLNFYAAARGLVRAQQRLTMRQQVLYSIGLVMYAVGTVVSLIDARLALLIYAGMAAYYVIEPLTSSRSSAAQI